MSFILDALRKSEARRKKGEVPGIETGIDQPTGERSRRRFPAWILLAVPVCLVAVAGGVMWMQPQWLPQGLVKQGANGASAPGAEPAEVREPADVAADETPGEEIVAQLEPVEDVRGGAATADEPADEAADPEQPEIADRRRAAQPATGQTVTRAAPERERVVTDPDEAAAEIERRVAETRQRQEQTERRRRAAEQPVADREREERRRVADTDAAADTGDDAPAQPEWRAQAAEYVRAWELPLSVRRSLPDLKLSIHVFSPEEEGRFVLINGERYVPGDALAGGARLVDIRREGAIVDFREHRFLLEP